MEAEEDKLINTPWGYMHAIDVPDFEEIDPAPLTLLEKLNRPRYAIAIMQKFACVMIGMVLAFAIVLISAGVGW